MIEAPEDSRRRRLWRRLLLLGSVALSTACSSREPDRVAPEHPTDVADEDSGDASISADPPRASTSEPRTAQGEPILREELP